MGLPKENRFEGRAVGGGGEDGQAIDGNLAKQLKLQEHKYKTKHGIALKDQLFLS